MFDFSHLSCMRGGGRRTLKRWEVGHEGGEGGGDQEAKRPTEEEEGSYLWRDGAGNNGWRNHLAESKGRGAIRS